MPTAEEMIKFMLGDNTIAEFTWNYEIEEEREIHFVVDVYDGTGLNPKLIYSANEILSDCDLEWGERESKAWEDFLIEHLEEVYNKLK